MAHGNLASAIEVGGVAEVASLLQARAAMRDRLVGVVSAVPVTQLGHAEWVAPAMQRPGVLVHVCGQPGAR